MIHMKRQPHKKVLTHYDPSVETASEIAGMFQRMAQQIQRKIKDNKIDVEKGELNEEQHEIITKNRREALEKSKSQENNEKDEEQNQSVSNDIDTSGNTVCQSLSNDDDGKTTNQKRDSKLVDESKTISVQRH